MLDIGYCMMSSYFGSLCCFWTLEKIVRGNFCPLRFVRPFGFAARNGKCVFLAEGYDLDDGIVI